MALVLFTGVVTQATLRANFDDKTAALSTQAVAGQVDGDVFHRVGALATGTGVANFLDFTAPDDMEVRTLRVDVTDGTAGRTVTGHLEQTDGDTSLLLDQVVNVSATTIIGSTRANLDMRTTTQVRRIKLLRGVRYRLRLETSAGPVTSAQVTVVLRTRRRQR